MCAKKVGRAGRLTGQRALVTGGGSGIGQAVARRFAEEGALGVDGGFMAGKEIEF